MKLLFTLFSLIFLSNIQAQVLEICEGEIYGDRVKFNREFIRERKIKSFKGYYSTKAEMDIIRPSENACYFEFNRSGLLVREYRVKYGDTTFFSYEYDYKSQIICERIATSKTYSMYLFEYDDSGRVTKREYRYTTTPQHHRYSFDLTEADRQSIEQYNYIDYDNGGYKKEYLNGIGRVYREEYYYLDGDNRLHTRESQTKNGSGRTSCHFSYDMDDRLTTVESTVKLTEENVRKSEFEYDENGNISAQRYYKNGEYITEKQIVYRVDTQELKAVIDRKEGNNFMTILQFKDYHYF